MPRDLTDLLAEALPRDTGAPDLGAIESRVARRRVGRLGAAVLALAAAVAVGVQALPIGPPAPMIDQVEDTAPAGTTLLPLPAAGEVAAAHANGRPVFVVHDGDGEVRVLDAISPHVGNLDFMKVLAYCTTSGRFVDPWHGSMFSLNGAWAGGPAPHGLAEHEVLRTTGDTVVVGDLLSAPTRDGRQATEPTGPDCGDTLSGVRVDDLLMHTATATELAPGLHYAEYPTDGGDAGLLVREEPQVPLPGDDVTLPLPAPGEVSADHVNGRPVFVRNDGDGSVLVLDAVNPHVTEFGPKVLAWCHRAPDLVPDGESFPTGGVPFDPWYSSAFTRDGAWGTGPAPTGLGRLPVRTVTSQDVTVAGSPLLAPPRVQDADGTTPDATSEGCSNVVALFPDWLADDWTILGDLVLHEPLFEDDWWYPTPDRLMGEAPGLPPDELDQYLAEQGIDLGELDLTDLPSLGNTGLAVQRQLGVELLSLDGTSHGLLRDAAFTHDDARDGLGGPVLLLTAEGDEVWVDPSSGTTLAADGVTALRGSEALVERGDGTHESLTAYGPDEDGPTVVPGPLRVSNAHRLVSGPDCLMNAGTSCGDGSRTIDTDVGGTGTTTPGCNATDGFADFNVVSTCWLEDGAWLEVDMVGPEGPVRIDVPRYPGQPDDQRTIGYFRNAVFGGPGVVAQLSLECEIPAVVGFDLDGTPVDLWGGDAWSDGPTSVLLGTAVLPDGGGPVPLVQVAAGACGDTKGVPEGVWAITDDGPVQLNDVSDPVALWTGGADLVGIDLQLADRAVAATACTGEAAVLVGDVDLDGDGRPDTVRLHELADDHVRKLVACLANGRWAVREVGDLVEDAFAVQLGDDPGIAIVQVVEVTGTTHDAHTLLRVFGDRFVALAPQDGASAELDLRSGELHDDGDVSWVQWGCRTTEGPGGRPRIELVSVEAAQTDNGTEVTIASYEVNGATTELLEVNTEAVAGPPATAADATVAQLGATTQCRLPGG